MVSGCSQEHEVLVLDLHLVAFVDNVTLYGKQSSSAQVWLDAIKVDSPILSLSTKHHLTPKYRWKQIRNCSISLEPLFAIPGMVETLTECQSSAGASSSALPVVLPALQSLKRLWKTFSIGSIRKGLFVGNLLRFLQCSSSLETNLENETHHSIHLLRSCCWQAADRGAQWRRWTFRLDSVHKRWLVSHPWWWSTLHSTTVLSEQFWPSDLWMSLGCFTIPWHYKYWRGWYMRVSRWHL